MRWRAGPEALRLRAVVEIHSRCANPLGPCSLIKLSIYGRPRFDNIKNILCRRRTCCKRESPPTLCKPITPARPVGLRWQTKESLPLPSGGGSWGTFMNQNDSPAPALAVDSPTSPRAGSLSGGGEVGQPWPEGLDVGQHGRNVGVQAPLTSLHPTRPSAIISARPPHSTNQRWSNEWFPADRRGSFLTHSASF